MTFAALRALFPQKHNAHSVRYKIGDNLGVRIFKGLCKIFKKEFYKFIKELIYHNYKTSKICYYK